MEKRSFVDQHARIDAFFARHAVELASQGTIVRSYRERSGKRTGPYCRLTCRDGQGRQISVYLGCNKDFVERTRQRLADLQTSRKRSAARRCFVAALRRERRLAAQEFDRNLAIAGLQRKGGEIRGWRCAEFRSQ